MGLRPLSIRSWICLLSIVFATGPVLLCRGVASATTVIASSMPPGESTTSAVTFAPESSGDARLDELPEARELGRHLVLAGRQQGRDVVPGAVRGVGALEPRALVDHAHGGAGDGRALRVLDDAADLAGVELRVRGRGQRDQRDSDRPPASASLPARMSTCLPPWPSWAGRYHGRRGTLHAAGTNVSDENGFRCPGYNANPLPKASGFKRAVTAMTRLRPVAGLGS